MMTDICYTYTLMSNLISSEPIYPVIKSMWMIMHTWQRQQASNKCTTDLKRTIQVTRHPNFTLPPDIKTNDSDVIILRWHI
jgi:hypothetical protein